MIEIDINGNKQWIYIRGNENAPLLLFLHGGPGITNGIYLQEPFFQALEKEYLVAYWDQRCSGKSFSFKNLTEPIDNAILVEDTKQVTHCLLKKFQRDKLVLFGFSYGAYTAIKTANDCPWLYEYYIAIGQPANEEKTALEGYLFLERFANETNNIHLLKKIKKIGKPPYQKELRYIRFRLLLDKFGGFKFNRKTKLYQDYIAPLLSAKVYSFKDKWKWFFGLFTSLTRIDIQKIDFEGKAIELKIPSLFISGERDYITPISLVKELLEEKENPLYRIAVIPKAAHDAHLEQPDYVLEQIALWKEKNVKKQ